MIGNRKDQSPYAFAFTQKAKAFAMLYRWHTTAVRLSRDNASRRFHASCARKALVSCLEAKAQLETLNRFHN